MSEDQKSIRLGDKVTMHFSMLLADGSIADSTKVNDLPGEVIIGDGTLSNGFETQVIGLKADDQKTFNLSPEDAFGEVNEANIYMMPVAQHLEK